MQELDERRIAAVLREHARWEHGTGPDGYPTHRCRCGIDLPHGRADRVAPLHRAHVAAAIAADLAASGPNREGETAEHAFRRVGHTPTPRPADDGEMCRRCGFFWPCDTIQTARKIDAARLVASRDTQAPDALARVRALADEWEDNAANRAWESSRRVVWQSCADHIRAALDSDTEEEA